MTLGSGSLAAMGVLECDFRVGMEKKEAMDLVCRAVLGGVWNDLGSGGSVDLVIMEKDKVGSLPWGLSIPSWNALCLESIPSCLLS